VAAPTIVNNQWALPAGTPVTVALSFTPTAGNRLLVLQAFRGEWTTGNPPEVRNLDESGDLYTVLQDYGGDSPYVPGGGGSNYWDSGIQAVSRVATGTETVLWCEYAGGGGIVILEIAGDVASVLSAKAINLGASATVSGPSVSPPTPALVIGWLSQGSDNPGTVRDLDSAWTIRRSQTVENPTSLKPHAIAVSSAVPAGAASPPASSDQSFPGWSAITIAFAEPFHPGLFADWDGDGFGDPGTSDEISGTVASWKISRGASAEITGGATLGAATIVLNDPDGRYNPRNASGPLYGKLTDGVPLWLGVNSDGAFSGIDPRGLFAGRMTDITPLPSGGADTPPQVEIGAEDALGWYGRTPAQLAYAEGRAQGAFRAAVLAAAGETRTDLAHEIATMPLSNADGDLLGVLEALNKANGTRHFCKPADSPYTWYAYTTRNRQHGLTGTADAALSVESDHVTGSTGWRLSADTVINRQSATVVPIVFTPGTLTVWEASDLPIEVTTARPYEVVVSFDDFVAGPILDIASTGATVTAVLTPFGQAAKVSLSVASGTATVLALSIEGSLARRPPAETAVANDTASQAGSRGIRAGADISGELVGTLASARGIAEHVVWRYGTPQLRPTLTVVNWIPEMFELDLCDIIAVTSPQMSLTSHLFEIVGLTLEGIVAASADLCYHVATYVLEECRVQSDPGWFVLNSSLLDSADSLAY
jgi:hypothetical protein